MNHLHVGRGTTRGALTVFPLWAEVTHPVAYSMDAASARVGELPDGPSVGMVLATNTGGVPLLLLEGQLLEGGLQHRMVARSLLLEPGTPTPLPVVCVEQGRWHGGGGHKSQGRRASVRVRAGLRADDRQGEVWRRVNEYAGRFGENPTSSYLEHADRADATVRRLVRGLRPFPGQVGVLVGVAGQPLFAEVFDSPRMLARQFDQIVHAGAMDAVGLPPIETPGRRARRFIDRIELVAPEFVGDAGAAQAVVGRSQYVELSGLRWQGHDLHTLFTNPRHELVLAG